MPSKLRDGDSSLAWLLLRTQTSLTTQAVVFHWHVHRAAAQIMRIHYLALNVMFSFDGLGNVFALFSILTCALKVSLQVSACCGFLH